MTRLMFHTTSQCKAKTNYAILGIILVFTVSMAVLTAPAELHQNTLMVDATDRENWLNLFP